jgi:hypothetical protein
MRADGEKCGQYRTGNPGGLAGRIWRDFQDSLLYTKIIFKEYFYATKNTGLQEAQMPSDREVRDVVRQLMRLFDSMDARYASFLYVVAEKDPEEYTRLLDTSERITPRVTKVLAVGDSLHRQVYESLDDPNADWCKAMLSWLTREGPIILTREQGCECMRLMESDES